MTNRKNLRHGRWMILLVAATLVVGGCQRQDGNGRYSDEVAQRKAERQAKVREKIAAERAEKEERLAAAMEADAEVNTHGRKRVPRDAGPAPTVKGGACHFDAIGRKPADTTPLLVEQPFYISGWAWQLGADGKPARAWVRLASTEGDGGRELPVFATTERPDVAAFLKQEQAIESGFDVPVKDLPNGRYSIGIVFEQADGSLVACDESREAVIS